MSLQLWLVHVEDSQSGIEKKKAGDVRNVEAPQGGRGERGGGAGGGVGVDAVGEEEGDVRLHISLTTHSVTTTIIIISDWFFSIIMMIYIRATKNGSRSKHNQIKEECPR